MPIIYIQRLTVISDGSLVLCTFAVTLLVITCNPLLISSAFALALKLR